jgi:O-antigen ligase
VSTAVWQRHQAPLVLLAAAALSLPAGLLVARSEHGVSLALLAIVGLCGLVVMLSLPTSTLFLGWFFLAPIFQVAAEESALGLAGVWGLYTVPAVLFVVMTLGRVSSATISWLELFPLGYILFVLGSVILTSEDFQSRTTGVLRAVFLTVAIGVVVYYFLTLGPGRAISGERILRVLLAGGIVQALLALIEFATLWTLWPSTGWQDLGGNEFGRVSGTLANPAVTAAYIGSAIVTAVAVLACNGPPALRRLSIATLVLAVPAILTTLTRAPILATLVGVLLILLVSRARYVALVVAASGAIALVTLLPTIQHSSLYERRVGESKSILARSSLQDWSIRLWKQKPIVGFGWDSFDEVKNATQFSAGKISTRIVRAYTSHNSYLTILVELGAVGFLLFVTPFVVIGVQALPRARLPSPDQWLVVASLASLLVIVLTALTVDFRFFSIAQMLPWLFLALLRRATAPTWS